MGEQLLPDDFKEFLKLLTEHAVEYLLIGGYAVGYHGYLRATADMDIWVALSPDNASRLVDVFKSFGISDDTIQPAEVASLIDCMSGWGSSQWSVVRYQ